MPISKALKDALAAWKEGKGEYPEALDTGVFFDSDAGFVKAAEEKGKGHARKAAEAKQAELLAALGITDPAQIEEVKAKLAATDTSLSEAERLKAENAKLTKERAKDAKAIEELTGFKTTVTKSNALEPHLAKVHPDLRPLVKENWLSKLTVGDDGKVIAPEGKELAAFVDEQIKANQTLKAPDYKAGGAGTSGNPPKGAPTNGTDTRTPAQKVVAEMLATHAGAQNG